MKLVFMIQHPAHVHFFKHAIKELSTDHKIKVFVRDKEIITDLLDAYDIDFTILTGLKGESLSNLDALFSEISYEYNAWKYIKDIYPDLILTIGGPTAIHIAKLLDISNILFTDSEKAVLQNMITYPFADRIYTPSCYKEEIGTNQVRYDGYHELAYLHPERFSPDLDVLDNIDADQEDNIIILRFIGWGAAHDVGQFGFSKEQKRKLVSKLNKHGNVYITSETQLPSEFEEYRLTVPPHRIHDLLYYANLYIGDSQTMATEAALLGTPAIRSNSFAGENDMGNFQELENKYGLLFSTPNSEEAINKALEWIKDPYLDEKWKKKRKKLLEDKIDVTKFLIDTILKEGSS